MTPSPILTWLELLLFPFLLFSKSKKQGFLDSWCRKNESAFFCARSSLALAAVIRWRQFHSNKKHLVVWLPDYYCESTVKELNIENIELFFYPIDLNFHINSAINRNDFPYPDVFVFVHYFGNIVDSKKVVEFCKATGACLVEDAVHFMCPVPNVGEIGDFVLYSPHKHLPIPDGAICVMKNSVFTLEGNHFNCKKIQSGCSGFDAFTSHFFWVVKKIVQLFGFRKKLKNAGFKATESDDKLKYFSKFGSWISICYLNKYRETMYDFVKKRIENVEKWKKYLSLPSHAAFVNDGLYPYWLAVAFQTTQQAEIFYKKMIKSGCPVCTWPDLPNSVLRENSPIHEQAIYLRNTRVYLPVHQTILFSEIKSISKKMNAEFYD